MNEPTTDCQGTWRERTNHETEDPLLVCDGCGEMAVIRNNKWISLGIPTKEKK